MKRVSPRRRGDARTPASSFSKPYTNKNSFPPTDVQAASARSDDKPVRRVSKRNITEAGGGAN